jgi:hypothetical protein
LEIIVAMLAILFKILPALFAFIFGLIALVFSILSITSKDWAVREYYNITDSVTQWTNPIYTTYRSPFEICTAVANTSDPNPLTMTFVADCVRFPPFGFNQTSCELGIATQSDNLPNFGDIRLCQQIHLAGNYSITSLTFIAAGFILTMLLCAATIRLRSAAGEDADIQRDELAGRHGHHSQLWALIDFIKSSLLVFLFIGFVSALIAQFYGILGFIQSAPNNSDFSSSAAGSNDDPNTHGNHGPWYQGRVLSIYLTCAWGFAAASGFLAQKAWKVSPGYAGFEKSRK